jgi:hypothetical protein
MPQDAIILDKSSRFHSFYGQGPDATLDMEVMLYFCCVCNQIYIFNNALQPLVMAVKSTFGGLFNSRDGKGGGAGKKPLAGAIMAWAGKRLNWAESFDLLLETHLKIWSPHRGGNSSKTVGKGE